MSQQLHPSADRFVTEADGRTTRHSFSFGQFYDPANLGFAALVAHNDEVLPAGTGYPDHPHADLEIVTWVLSGALRHTDADGRSGVLAAGDVQRISAGSGIVHAEVADGPAETRFLQAWLRPDVPGGAPSYAAASGLTGLTEAVGPDGLAIGTAGARLLVGTAAGEVPLPDAPRLHLFLASGRARLDGTDLGPGDAVRLTDLGGATLEVTEPGSLAVWAFSS